jgi:hypothetical protein
MGTSEVGPYRTVGHDNPFYVLQYDKGGRTRSPETLNLARTEMRSRDFTDVVVFSHGWSNDWEAATARYNSFADGFVGQRADDPTRRALLLGIFWPSTLLVMPGEREPDIAGGNEAPQDPDTVARDDVTEALGAAAATRVKELFARDELNNQETTELASLLVPIYRGGVEELGEDSPPPTAQELASSWLTGPPLVTLPASEDSESEDWGIVDDTGSGPQAAAFWDRFDPRNAVRAASVWLMKDRAGRVGTSAVGPLLREALDQTDARVHLVGHSFGGKVVLSALCAEPVKRPVHSVLLLQPAVNHLCFSESVPGLGKPGGYREALARVERPIFSTYSAHDAPLTRFFHWALRRSGDLGEPQVAAWPDPPSDYAALGGFGPHGADADTQWVKLQKPEEAYTLDPDKKIAAVDGTSGIHGHGAVSIPETWWALRELMSA